MSHRTRSRVLASLGSVALAAGLLTVSAAPANAGFTLKPRTYTATIAPATAVSLQPTDYKVIVKNTSTRLSGLDNFELAIPAGFSVSAGSVTAPRGGWSESVSGGRVVAKTSNPVRYALRMGESMTVGFTATNNTACAASTATWVQKADGILIDPWVASSPDPTVQMTRVADRFVVTSVTDENSPALDHQVVQGAGFTTTGQFRCGAAAAPAGVDSTLTLSKQSAGSPNAGGTVGGTVSTTVDAGDTSAVISGTTYSAVENGVGIGVAWSAGAGDSFAIDVLGAAATVTGTPGTGIPTSALTVPGASADLGNGANGPVSIVVNACSDQAGAPCSNGTQVELTGDFKNGNVPLYNYLDPAAINWLCPTSQSGCEHPDSEGSNKKYTYNYDCTGNSCKGNGSLFGEREVEEDFAAFPVYVSIRGASGTYGPFQQAPRCVDLPTSNYQSNRSALLHVTGKMLSSTAQTTGFCVDVNAITRANNSFGGDLTIPVLFVEDLKLRP